MSNKLRKEQGFTLIELLIVVAIIGILAAIAIPQFAAYRQKGFNSAAVADLKNAKTAQESLFADNQTYGMTGGQATPSTLSALNTAVTPGAGELIVGPATAASSAVAGAYIIGNNSAGNPVAGGVGISNGVCFFANSMAEAAGAQSPAYLMATKHTQGTRVFEAETASTAVLFVQNDTWAGTALKTDGTPATFTGTAANNAAQVNKPGDAGNGAPITTWAAM